MGRDISKISEFQRATTYNDIFNRFVSNKPSLSSPRLILVGGQPGSGKSRLGDQAEEELSVIGSPVMVDIDDLRPYDPNAEEAFRQSPFKMSAITNRESWGWTSHLLLDARHAKNNAVYQATIRNADRVEDLIAEFQNEGFAVDMYVVAAHSRSSVYGIFYRFELGIQKMSEDMDVIPRWVTIPFHDHVYKVFPANVDRLAENARLERVGVFQRDGTPLYFSDGQLIHRGAGQAIFNERNRVWSEGERLLFRDNWQKLLKQIKDRPEDNLKPKWYVNLAELHSVEAEYLLQSRNIIMEPAPLTANVERRTPNNVFVRTETGEIDCYLRRPKEILSNKAKRAYAIAPQIAPK